MTRARKSRQQQLASHLEVQHADRSHQQLQRNRALEGRSRPHEWGQKRMRRCPHIMKKGTSPLEQRPDPDAGGPAGTESGDEGALPPPPAIPASAHELSVSMSLPAEVLDAVVRQTEGDHDTSLQDISK